MSDLFKFDISVDRPFGFYLWNIFTHYVESTGIAFKPSEFQFHANSPTTWMTRWDEVIAGIITYYVVIFGGRFLMNQFSLPVIKLTWLFRVHNLLLTLISSVLFVLLLEQLFPIIYREGVLYAICDKGSWTQPIVTLYYLNYLTKYYEFVDTVFLVLRKKPLTFLHTYHHGCTALLCFTQLIGTTSVSWVPIVLNLYVHIVMYWYYFLSSCNIKVWWKEWVTRIQIIQFVIDLFFVYFASYTYFTSTYWPWLPNAGSCAGEEFAAIYGCFLLSSYLFLFIAFYIRVYRKKSSQKSTPTHTTRSTRSKTAAASTPETVTGAKRKVGSERSTRSRKA